MSNNTRFMHVRNFGRGGKRNATVAYNLDQPGYLQYAVAYCSSKDQFNKRMGRTIAEGRLNTGTMKVIDIAAMGSDRYPVIHKYLREFLRLAK